MTTSTQRNETKIRPAAVAGGFYPADAASLNEMMQQMLDQAPAASLNGETLALIAPHAGYIYSGPVAACAYSALAGKNFHRVVIIAPSHAESFPFSSVYDGEAYETPLGTLSVDQEFAAALAKASSTIRLSGHGHATTEQRSEHAVEVQLPWLQHQLGDFLLVPIVMGEHSYEASRALGVALAELCQDGKTLLVASSDLSHYHAYDEAVRMDHQALEAIAEWDYFNLSRNVANRHWEACGAAPIVATMIASERLGANQAQILYSANSGNTAGSRDRVVGYGAVALLRSTEAKEATHSYSINAEDKTTLLALARSTVETAVREDRALDPPTETSPELQQERGAFTSLHLHGKLRGCIGFTAPRKTLAGTVRDTALLAALRDPRFSPVQAAELDDLEYEISVLSPLRRVLDPTQIKIGVHGLLIKNGDKEGLLLPQVPVEWKWDRETFLAQSCHKAGLPLDAWKDPETDIFAFTAVVFHEKRHR